MGVGARPVLALGGGSEWVLLAGLLLIILALLMTLRKKRRTISGPNLTAREHLGRLKEEQGLRSDLESLMVDIEQLAKRLGSQLDAKVIQVEKLVAEADRRIEILRNLKATPPAEGFNEVLLPGEPERRAAERRGEEGVPMPDEVWDRLKAAGETVGIDLAQVVSGEATV